MINSVFLPLVRNTDGGSGLWVVISVAQTVESTELSFHLLRKIKFSLSCGCGVPDLRCGWGVWILDMWVWVRGLDSWHVGVGVGVRFGSTVWLWKMKFWFGYLWVYVCVFKRVCIYCFWIVGKGKKHEIWSGEERKYGLWEREKKSEI